MFGLFKKKKEAQFPDINVPMPPAPAPLSVPDNHPLDQPFDHPLPGPSTDFADSQELDEIRNAIDAVKIDEPEEKDNPILDERDLQVEKDDMFSQFEEEEKPAPIAPVVSAPIVGPTKSMQAAQQQAKQQEIPLPELSKPEPEKSMDLPSFEEVDEESPKGMPTAYNLTNMPDPEDLSKRKQAFSIYINVKDYGRIFKEIKYIDSFSKKCFRTVMKLKDLSGNQTKLYARFHSDLTYINERLTLMDTIFFEQQG